MKVRTLAAATAALLFTGSANAALVITETMSSSGVTADWFEVTNTGPGAVTMTGLYVDDSSADPTLGAALLGITSIAANETVLFIETSDPDTLIPEFRTFWGGTANSPTKIGSYSGSGLGLSSSGDAVNIYSGNGVGATLLAHAGFGAATSGRSFDLFDANGNNGVAAVNGVRGAFTSADSAGNVGSPGVVPEPAGLGLAGLAGVLAMRRRRK